MYCVEKYDQKLPLGRAKINFWIPERYYFVSADGEDHLHIANASPHQCSL